MVNYDKIVISVQHYEQVADEITVNTVDKIDYCKIDDNVVVTYVKQIVIDVVI